MFVKKVINWFKESNRKYHFLFALPICCVISLILLGVYSIFYSIWSAYLLSCRGAMLFVAGLATGLEIKDAIYSGNGMSPSKWNWKNFDVIDLACTLFGGVVWLLVLLLITWIIV